MPFTVQSKDSRFFDYFHSQADLLVQVAETLRTLFETMEAVEDKCSRINRLERQGNTLYEEIIDELNRAKVTPIERADIYSLAGGFETLLDSLRSISVRIGLFNLKEAPRASRDLVGLLGNMIKEILAMADQLARFEKMDPRLQNVWNLYDDAETLYQLALAELYESGENRILEVVKWTQIYDRLAETIKMAERLAFQINSLIVIYE